jgi:hypothetical protein
VGWQGRRAGFCVFFLWQLNGNDQYDKINPDIWGFDQAPIAPVEIKENLPIKDWLFNEKKPIANTRSNPGFGAGGLRRDGRHPGNRPRPGCQSNP